MENAKSGSGRLGTARPILPDASQGGELCAAAPVPLAGLLAKLSAVVYCGYPVATLEGYPVASLGVSPAVTLELPWSYPGGYPVVQGSVLSSAIAGATGLQRRRKQRQAGLPIFTRQLMPVPTLYGRWSRGNDRLILGSLFPYKIFFRKLRL